jgi:exopolyphosphatase / guanosine-5'-triphosphate,3'-diphosphate pyrophosphatase
MKPVRRAVIDVGTNSIKLLVADVAAAQVQPVWEGSIQTRLGQGFYETHTLRPEAIAQTAEAVEEFAKIARRHEAVSIRVIATSAARDAVNPQNLMDAIHAAANLNVEIISGDQEAEWAFQGVTTDPKLAAHPLLLLDVGGGSTEFILGQGKQTHFARSFPLGTVRLLEKIQVTDPPSARELGHSRDWVKHFLEESVRSQLEPALTRESKLGRIELVGTGGTASILARMEAKLDAFNRESIEGTRLTLPCVKRHVEHLWSLPLVKRQQIVGLPNKRADVILSGAAIYEAVMEQFGFSELRVSTRGLRFAAVMEAEAGS